MTHQGGGGEGDGGGGEGDGGGGEGGGGEGGGGEGEGGANHAAGVMVPLTVTASESRRMRPTDPAPPLSQHSRFAPPL